MMRISRTATAYCISLLLIAPGNAAKKPRGAPRPAAITPAPSAPPPAAISTPVSGDTTATSAGTSTVSVTPVPDSLPPSAATATVDPQAASGDPSTVQPSGDQPASKPILNPAQEAAAIQHFELGGKAFAEGRYEQALEEFTSSYEISKEPDLLYNLHKVAIKLGNPQMAISYLKQYVLFRPTEAEKIQREIDQLQAPAAVLPPPAPVVPTERSTPRPVGYLLTGLGTASLVTGGTLLGAMTTVSNDPQRRAMLASGAVLLTLGVVELIGGITIVTRKRSQSTIALRMTGSGFLLAGRF